MYAIKCIKLATANISHIIDDFIAFRLRVIYECAAKCNSDCSGCIHYATERAVESLKHFITKLKEKDKVKTTTEEM